MNDMTKLEIASGTRIDMLEWTIDSLTVSGDAAIGGDLTVSGTVYITLSEFIYGDFVLGDADDAGGDAYGYQDAVGTEGWRIDTSAGQLQLPISGSGAGVLLGGDALIYRVSANLLRTPDGFTVDGAFTASGGATLSSAAVSDLTSGRVVIAGASGELADDADFTFVTDTLTVTKIGAFEATGTIDLSAQDITTTTYTINETSTYFEIRPTTGNTAALMSLLPAGTSNSAQFEIYATNAYANSEWLQMNGDGTNFYVSSRSTGSGTLRPMQLRMQTTARLTVNTDGTLTVGGATDFGGLGVTNVGAAGNDFGASNALVATTVTGNFTVADGYTTQFGQGDYVTWFYNNGEADSRGWAFRNDHTAYGDFVLTTEATQGGGFPGTVRLQVDKTGQFNFQSNAVVNVGAAGNDFGASNSLVATTFSGTLDMNAQNITMGGGYVALEGGYLHADSNSADAGYIRLPNAGVINWRNAANGANISLTVDSSDQFDFGSNAVVNVGAAGNDFGATNSLVATSFSGDIDLNGQAILGVAEIKSEFDATDYLDWVADDQFDILIDSGAVASFQDDMIQLSQKLDMNGRDITKVNLISFTASEDSRLLTGAKALSIQTHDEATNLQSRVTVGGGGDISRVQINAGGVLNIAGGAGVTAGNVEGDLRINGNKLEVYLNGAWEIVNSA